MFTYCYSDDHKLRIPIVRILPTMFVKLDVVSDFMRNAKTAVGTFILPKTDDPTGPFKLFA